MKLGDFNIENELSLIYADSNTAKYADKDTPGVLKTGFSKTGTKIPVQMDNGNAYVDVTGVGKTYNGESGIKVNNSSNKISLTATIRDIEGWNNLSDVYATSNHTHNLSSLKGNISHERVTGLNIYAKVSETSSSSQLSDEFQNYLSVNTFNTQIVNYSLTSHTHILSNLNDNISCSRVVGLGDLATKNEADLSIPRYTFGDGLLVNDLSVTVNADNSTISVNNYGQIVSLIKPIVYTASNGLTKKNNDFQALVDGKTIIVSKSGLSAVQLSGTSPIDINNNKVSLNYATPFTVTDKKLTLNCNESVFEIKDNLLDIICDDGITKTDKGIKANVDNSTIIISDGKLSCIGGGSGSPVGAIAPLYKNNNNIGLKYDLNTLSVINDEMQGDQILKALVPTITTYNGIDCRKDDQNNYYLSVLIDKKTLEWDNDMEGNPNTIKVKYGNSLSGGGSGLEIKVDGKRGLGVDSDGIYVKVDSNTIDFTDDGTLSVTYSIDLDAEGDGKYISADVVGYTVKVGAMDSLLNKLSVIDILSDDISSIEDVLDELSDNVETISSDLSNLLSILQNSYLSVHTEHLSSSFPREYKFDVYTPLTAAVWNLPGISAAEGLKASYIASGTDTLYYGIGLDESLIKISSNTITLQDVVTLSVSKDTDIQIENLLSVIDGKVGLSLSGIVLHKSLNISNDFSYPITINNLKVNNLSASVVSLSANCIVTNRDIPVSVLLGDPDHFGGLEISGDYSNNYYARGGFNELSLKLPTWINESRELTNYWNAIYTSSYIIDETFGSSIVQSLNIGGNRDNDYAFSWSKVNITSDNLIVTDSMKLKGDYELSNNINFDLSNGLEINDGLIRVKNTKDEWGNTVTRNLSIGGISSNYSVNITADSIVVDEQLDGNKFINISNDIVGRFIEINAGNEQINTIKYNTNDGLNINNGLFRAREEQYWEEWSQRMINKKSLSIDLTTEDNNEIELKIKESQIIGNNVKISLTTLDSGIKTYTLKSHTIDIDGTPTEVLLFTLQSMI